MNHLRKEYFDSLLKSGNDLSLLRAKKTEILRVESNQSVVLYKYCNIDTAVKIINSNSVLLQPPDNFNDPYDCLNAINIWGNESRFGPDKQDFESLGELLSHIPDKFQLPQYKVYHDLRNSYCFAISCFSSSYKNHLMWSHYADRHKGVCLEFEIQNRFDDIHPCYYTDAMPDLSWQSKNLNLSLIKCNAWNYESEWRWVKAVTRPVMRLFGSITSQIYHAVHTDKKYSTADHEEWSKVCSEMHRDLERNYNKECAILLRPSKIYLGLLYGHNYSNAFTGDQCKQIISYANKFNIPIHRMTAAQNNFNLYDEHVKEKEGSCLII